MKRQLCISILFSVLVLAASVAEAITQPSGTEAAFFTTDGSGNMSNLGYRNWSRDWFRIVPLHFPGMPQGSLLFYNRAAGTAKLYHVTNGQLGTVVKTYSGWRTSWDHILPIRVVGGKQSKQSLFFYDRSNQLGRTYHIEANGNLVHVADTTLGDYDLAIAGAFRTSRIDVADVALYSRAEGRVDYCFFNEVGIPTCSSGSPTEKRWDVMLAGNFTSSANDEILFWDRDASLLQLVRPTLLTEPLAFVSQRTDFTFSENMILAVGDFDLHPFSDLLVYDPRNDDPTASGEGRFYLNDGAGDFGTPVQTHIRWRKTWGMIITGRFSDSDRSTLLFYDNTRVIDVLVVRGANDDGSGATNVTVAKMDGWVKQLNRTFSTAGLRFQRQHSAQLLEYGRFNEMDCDNTSDLIKVELSAWASETPYTPGDGADLPPPMIPDDPSRRPRLLIYLPQGLSTNQCSSTAAQFVLASGSSAAHKLTHEVGHFFSLAHVFNESIHGALKTEYKSDSSTPDEADTAELVGRTLSPNTLSVFDVDAACSDPDIVCPLDTPPDPGPYYWPLAYADFESLYCDPSIEIPVTDRGVFLFDINPDRFNLMTYRIRAGAPSFDLYAPCPRTTMTADQARRARQFLASDGGGKKRLIEP